MYQEQLWFSATHGYKPSPKMNRDYLNSSDCPMSGFIGNKDAVDMMRAVSYFSWMNSNHVVADRSSGTNEKINIALLGDAGLGKTTLAKMFAKTVRLPFAELHKVSKVQEIFDAANKELLSVGTPIAVHNGRLKVPPMIWFVDEVHRYVGRSRRSPSGIMNDLLKATEPDDATLTNGKWILDCSNVCWVVATTEWHLLPSPFRSRFMEVRLFPYTEDDVTEIVEARFKDMPEDVCRLAARHGCLVPRQALNFAKMFRFEKAYQNIPWLEAAENIAKKKGIDEWGMTAERREVLTLLGKHESLSKDKLSLYTGQPEIELDEIILPPLFNPADGEPLIRHGGRGWSLLPAGVEELKKRDISCTVHVSPN